MAKSARTENLGGVVRGGELYRGKQGLDYTPGVSAETVGSRALWLGSVTLPPAGGRTKAHIHEQHESAFCMISGEEVEVYTGEQLEHRDVATPATTCTSLPGCPTWWSIVARRRRCSSGRGPIPTSRKAW